jgi:putative membrane protein insertion efficiency factor
MTPRSEPNGVFLVALFFSMMSLAIPAFGSDLTMQGPKEKEPERKVNREIEPSCVKLAFLGAIRVYQKRVSSSGGPDRCGFRPSCSAYGHQAIEEEGLLVALLMTADRLTRCNIFKEPGPDYTLLPNGKLYDPPSKNILFGRREP